MTYARSGTAALGEVSAGLSAIAKPSIMRETNLAPLRRGFFVGVACTLSQANAQLTDDQQNLATRSTSRAFVCEVPLRCATNRQPTRPLIGRACWSPFAG